MVICWSLLAAAALSSLSAQGQCSCTTTLTNTDTTPAAGSIVCVPAGLTYSATLTLSNNNVTVCNSGTISGTIVVSGNGATINNLSVMSGPLVLSKPTTLNNGSSNGGATIVRAAAWSGYQGGSITAPPLINNYASWTVALQPVAGATINNLAGAIYNASYLTTSAALNIVNAGAWQTQIAEASNSPLISITQNGGSWTGGIGGGTGSLRVTNNATWTQGFNFPTGVSNAFTTATGATTNFNNYFGLYGMVVLTNNGTMSASAGMSTISSTSSLLVAAGSTFSLGANELNNQGTLINRGTITASNSTNVGSLSTSAGSTLTLTGNFTNQAPGTLQNSGTITASNNFTNSATITGPLALPRGRFKAANYTVNSGNFGADGSYLDFCDGTPPTPASQGFDARGGTIGNNVTYCAAAPLPVTLTFFSVAWRQGEVIATWATASELNSAQFILERSADGYQFAGVQTVAGQGTSSQATAYSTVDAAPLAGPAFYRLQQLDGNGTRTYSPVVLLLPPAGSSNAQLVCYPNPTTSATLLDLMALPTGDYEVLIMDTLGKLVYKDLVAGGQKHRLSLDSLPAGTYLLRVGSPAQGYAMQRLVKN